MMLKVLLSCIDIKSVCQYKSRNALLHLRTEFRFSEVYRSVNYIGSRAN